MVQKTNFKWPSQSSCVRGGGDTFWNFSAMDEPNQHRMSTENLFWCICYEKFPFSGHNLIEAETSKIAEKIRLEFSKWRTHLLRVFSPDIGFVLRLWKMKEISVFFCFRCRIWMSEQFPEKNAVQHVEPLHFGGLANKKSRENFLNLWLLGRCCCCACKFREAGNEGKRCPGGRKYNFSQLRWDRRKVSDKSSGGGTNFEESCKW